MRKIALIGTGDLARIVINMVQTFNLFEVKGCFDDFQTNSYIFQNIPILGKLDKIEKDYLNGHFDELVLAVGYSRMKYRREVFERFLGLIPFATIIHPSTIVDPTANIGQGNILFSGCILDQGVVLSENCLLFNGVVISHDSFIGKHTFLAPRVTIAGFVKVGEDSILGINTTIIDNIKMVNNVKTGGGCVVTKDIIEPGLYVGVPAKKIKCN